MMPTGRHLKKDSPRYVAEVKANQVSWHKRHKYWSPRRTIAFLQRAVRSLSEWKYQTGLAVLNRWQKSCAWLEGRALGHVRLPGVYGRPVAYNLTRDIKHIARAMNAGEWAPPYIGLQLLDDVAAELGCVRDHVLWLHKKWRRAIGRSNDKPKLKWGRNENGYPVRRSYVTNAFVAWAKRRRTPEEIPADEMPVAEAADVLGKPRSNMLPIIKKRQVPSILRRLSDRSSRTRTVRTVSRAILQHTQSNFKPKAPHASSRGRGRPADPETAALYLECFEAMQMPTKRSQQLRALQAVVGTEKVPDDDVMRLYAKRHARRNSLPWTTKGEGNGGTD